MFDLRSDTVTQPTEAMRAAMASAEVGDDVLGEDPTVIRLQERAAEILGKPAALFLPTATMGNQTCLGVLTRPGDEIIASEDAHVMLNEAGAASRLWGCQVRTVTSVRGAMDIGAVLATIRDTSDIHFPRTSVLSLENTHNYAGGAVLDLGHIDAVTAIARERGLAVHMDGARLFNAQEASGVPAARIVRDVDMVSVCLSKGLGAPAGALVAGDAERIAAALRVRKTLGGGMRQVGVLAAPGLLALEEGPAALAADHARARQLAEALASLSPLEVDLAATQSNIVIADCGGRAFDWERRYAALGVRMFALDDRRLRFVFHRDVGDAALQAAMDVSRKLFG